MEIYNYNRINFLEVWLTATDSFEKARRAVNYDSHTISTYIFIEIIRQEQEKERKNDFAK